MSRGALRFVVATVVLIGGLALAPPPAEADGREVRDQGGLWSLVVEWVGEWRVEVFGWEMEGPMIDPNGGNQLGSPPEEEGTNG